MVCSATASAKSGLAEGSIWFVVESHDTTCGAALEERLVFRLHYEQRLVQELVEPMPHGVLLRQGAALGWLHGLHISRVRSGSAYADLWMASTKT